MVSNVERRLYQLLNKTNVNNLVGLLFVLTARIPQIMIHNRMQSVKITSTSLHGVTSKNKVFFIVTDMRISNAIKIYSVWSTLGDTFQTKQPPTIFHTAIKIFELTHLLAT
jgi:hypothetical protein